MRCTLSAKLAGQREHGEAARPRQDADDRYPRGTHFAAGSTTAITVALTSKAKQRLTKSRLKSFKATFTASAGGTNARRTVTVRR